MPINKRVTSWAKKWWNSPIVGSLCETVGIEAGDSYCIQKYLPNGYSVHSGVFKGMKYLDTATGSSLNPKLIGTYESQVYPWIEKLKDSYKHIINLGCAEGYYAVGLALRFPHSHVYAYDTDAIARTLCAKLARINNVSNISLGSHFGAKNMKLHKGESLIVCDIEGAEVDLLDPHKHPPLLEYDFIIECHDHILPASATLIDRFQKTHAYQIRHEIKQNTKPAGLSHMPNKVFVRMSDEGRLTENPVWLQLMRKK